jgi:TatD DNase family protein
MAVRWFDTHVHLERYAAVEARAMVERATAAGVTRLLAVSTSPASSARTMALPPDVVRAVGVHPTKADAEALRWLAETRSHLDADAMGECGFDDAGPGWEVQEAVFDAQLRIAHESAKPLLLHVDGPAAWERLVAKGSAIEGLTLVRHYFAGGEEQARWHAQRGHFVSFGRPLLRDVGLQRVAASLPGDLLLIETDTYPLAGRLTEPRDLVEVGKALAALRGWSVEECAERVWANSARALRLPVDA